MVPRIALLLLPLLAFSTVKAPAPVFAKHYFGVSLATGAHSALYTCFTVKEFEGEIVGISGLTPDQFIMQATANITSIANPDSVDFFEEYKVSSCVKLIDPETGLERRPCKPFDQLWKLRFSKYPFMNKDGIDHGEGWAKHETKPSDAQLGILAGYGITHASGMCYGESAFKLLRDINDPLWVQRYRAAQ